MQLPPLVTRLPLSADRLERLLQPFLGRLVIVQGYLHSEDSPGMTIEVSNGAVRLVGDERVDGESRVKSLVRRLSTAAPLLGMMPIPGLAEIGYTSSTPRYCRPFLRPP